MKKIYFSLLSLILLAFSCDKEDPIPAPPVSSRTVLVYIMGDNSLQSFIEGDVEEMKEGFAHIAEENNLILFVDDGRGNSRIMKIEKNRQGVVEETLVKEYAEDLWSITPEVMSMVFSDVFSMYPADSYGLVLWSHGEGWLPDETERPIYRSIGQDGGRYGPKMNLWELAEVLRGFPPFEFVLFDACFMQSVEVAYELRNYANYFVGSPAETPGPGAPYHVILEPMFAREFNCEQLVDNYYTYYENNTGGDWGYGVAVSAIKSDELDELALRTSAIVPLYSDYLDNPDLTDVQIYDVRGNTWRNYCLYYDLGAFIKSFASESEYALWKKQVDKAVPYRRTGSSVFSAYIQQTFAIDADAYCGLSTYVMRPSTNYLKWNYAYKELEWYSSAGWELTNW